MRPASEGHPRVALVGRPNVGKSTLFNRLVGSRRAIVHDLPGMTRDRIVALANWDGRRFEVTDTGGIELDAVDTIPAHVRDQALRATRESAVVVLVVDGRDGVVPADAEIARALLRAGVRNLLLAVNKIDTMTSASLVADFARLGIEPTIGISAEHGGGLPELLDAVVERLPPEAAGEPAEAAPDAPPAIAVALVGRPNVGKSTLFNALVQDERSVVSEVAGTTRDTVDVLVALGAHLYRFLDTAGIRRPGRTERGPEVLSVVMARKTIARADVVVPVLDATQPIAHQDAAVAGLAEEEGRALVLAATKWDLVTDPDRRRRELEEDVARKLKFLPYTPLVTLSGRTKHGLDRLLEQVRRGDAASRIRIPTPRLNRFVKERLGGLTLPAPGAHAAHVLYATQTGVRPPTFVFFINRRVAPHFSTVRHVANALRDEFELTGTPVRVRFRSRGTKR